MKLFNVATSKEYIRRSKESKEAVLTNLKQFVKDYPDTAKRAYSGKLIKK